MKELQKTGRKVNAARERWSKGVADQDEDMHDVDGEDGKKQGSARRWGANRVTHH
jgi:hypothetical protein